MDTTLRPMRCGELRAGEQVSPRALVTAQLTLTDEAMMWVAALQYRCRRGTHDQMVCVGSAHRAHINAACLTSTQTGPCDREQHWPSREWAHARQQFAPPRGDQLGTCRADAHTSSLGESLGGDGSKRGRPTRDLDLFRSWWSILLSHGVSCLPWGWGFLGNGGVSGIGVSRG